MFFRFPLTNACLPSRWCKACALRWAVSHVLGLETPTHNTFDRISKGFLNLNFISPFSKKHTILVSTDSVIICNYLRRNQRKVLWKTTDGRFSDQENVRRQTLKWLKWGLVQAVNTFRDHSLQTFAAGKASLVIDIFKECWSIPLHGKKNFKESLFISFNLIVNASTKYRLRMDVI